MTHQRITLFTLLLSLGVLLSACGINAAPSDRLAEALPEGWVAMENPGGLATAAVGDGYLICWYIDANYQGSLDAPTQEVIGETDDTTVVLETELISAYCLRDDFEGVTSGVFGGTGITFPEELNDLVSSVQLKPGLTLQLFTEANYQGDSLTLTADTPYVGDALNDKISSYILTIP